MNSTLHDTAEISALGSKRELVLIFAIFRIHSARCRGDPFAPSVCIMRNILLSRLFE